MVDREDLFTELWRCREVAKINRIDVFKHQTVKLYFKRAK